jgi:hypothetical protein
MQGYYPKPFAQVPVALIRYFAGPHCAELLGLPRVDWPRMAVEAGIWLSTRWAGGDFNGQFQRFTGTLTQQVMKGLFLLQTAGQLSWADLLAEATRALGMLAPGGGSGDGSSSPFRHLAYWLMKGLVLAERDGQSTPFRVPAALGSGV